MAFSLALLRGVNGAVGRALRSRHFFEQPATQK
jgi:hypothetical protein